MAASAIVSADIRVDAFGDGQQVTYLQSAAIRLGAELGNLDGRMGPRTRDALRGLRLNPHDLAAAAAGIEDALQRAFPAEFFEQTAEPQLTTS